MNSTMQRIPKDLVSCEFYQSGESMESDGALHGNARGGLRMLESYTRLVITYIHTYTLECTLKK
jgi:hypothetical protein